jgi:hypothetical protein
MYKIDKFLARYSSLKFVLLQNVYYEEVLIKGVVLALETSLLVRILVHVKGSSIVD